MVVLFAADYINMGETMEKRQSYLNSACTAWNIAILDERERPTRLEEYLSLYQRINPHVSDVENFKHDMELLIQEKLRLFPHVKKVIMSAEIKNVDGKQIVTVASTTLPAEKERIRQKP
jgi:hypothetical protein